MLSHTQALAEDNQKLIGFLMDAAHASSKDADAAMQASMRGFVESCRQMLLYPLFCGNYVFGMLVCGADAGLFEIGEFLTFQLSRAICMNWVNLSNMI